MSKPSGILSVLSSLIRFILTAVMIWGISVLIPALVRLLLNVGYTNALFLTGIGFCAGLIFFSIISPFVQLYIFGHELTHWLVAKIFRRKTSGFRISRSYGSVKVERPNIWIVLAPYIFPLYTVLWIGFVHIVRMWYNSISLRILFFLGIGISYAYHVVTTTLALSKAQSDLRYFGTIFSICLIVLVNISILFWGLSMVSGDPERAISILKSTYRLQWWLITHLL